MIAPSNGPETGEVVMMESADQVRTVIDFGERWFFVFETDDRAGERAADMARTVAPMDATAGIELHELASSGMTPRMGTAVRSP